MCCLTRYRKMTFYARKNLSPVNDSAFPGTGPVDLTTADSPLFCLSALLRGAADHERRYRQDKHLRGHRKTADAVSDRHFSDKRSQLRIDTNSAKSDVSQDFRPQTTGGSFDILLSPLRLSSLFNASISIPGTHPLRADRRSTAVRISGTPAEDLPLNTEHGRDSFHRRENGTLQPGSSPE